MFHSCDFVEIGDRPGAQLVDSWQGLSCRYAHNISRHKIDPARWTILKLLANFEEDLH